MFSQYEVVPTRAIHVMGVCLKTIVQFSVGLKPQGR
jgi:hypothetical protein